MKRLLINLFIAVVTIYYLIRLKPWNFLSSIIWKGSNTFWIVGTAIFITALLLIKALKMYIILIEDKVPFERFFLTYLKSTFAMYTFPYKTGEFCRMYIYANATGNATVGIFSVAVDRYFDTLALISLLIPLEMLANSGFSFISILLLMFAMLVYITYKFAYRTIIYMNRHAIFRTENKKAHMILELLDKCENAYLYVEKLIHERTAAVYMLSLLAWICEYIAIKCLSWAIGIHFSLGDFSRYLTSFLTPNIDNNLFSIFIFLSIIMLIVLLIINIVVKLLNKGAHK